MNNSSSLKEGNHDRDGVWKSDLNQHRFLRFYFSVFSSVLFSIKKRYIKHGRPFDYISKNREDSWKYDVQQRSIFAQLRGLFGIVVKHGLSCLILLLLEFKRGTSQRSKTPHAQSTPKMPRYKFPPVSSQKLSHWKVKLFTSRIHRHFKNLPRSQSVHIISVTTARIITCSYRSPFSSKVRQMSRPWQLEVALKFCLISVDKGNTDWPVKELSVFARGWTQEQISRCYNTSHTRIMLGYLYYEYPVTFIFKLLQDLFSRVRPSNHFKLQRIFRPSNKNLFPKLTEVLDGRNKLGSGVGELWFFLVFIFYSYCQELSQDQYV